MVLFVIFLAGDVDGEEFFELDFLTISTMIPKLKTCRRFIKAWSKETHMIGKNTFVVLESVQIVI